MRLVVIDTNVWVSAFLNRKGFPARIKDAWIKGEFEVVLSFPLLQELSEVLHRPKSKTNIPSSKMKSLNSSSCYCVGPSW